MLSQELNPYLSAELNKNSSGDEIANVNLWWHTVANLSPIQSTTQQFKVVVL